MINENKDLNIEYDPMNDDSQLMQVILLQKILKQLKDLNAKP